MVFHGKAGVRKAFYLKPRHLADFTTHLQDTILQRVLQVQRGCTGGPKKVPKKQKKKRKRKMAKDGTFIGEAFSQGRTGTPFEALAKLTVPGNLQ